MKKNSESILKLFFSIILSTTLILSINLNGYYFDKFDIKDIIIFIFFVLIIYFFSSLIIKLLKNIYFKQHSNNTLLVFIISFIIITISFIICFIIFYPGLLYVDEAVIIINGHASTYTHPVLFVLFSQGCFSFSNNLEIGMVVYTIIQILITSLSFSYCIAWLSSKKVPKTILIIIALIYSVVPIFPIYSITTTKDIFFASFITMSIPIIYDIIKDKKISLSQYIVLCLLIFLIINFNNNGFLIIITMIPLILILKYKLMPILIILCTILISIIPRFFAYNEINRNSFAMKLQLVSSVIVYEDNIDKEDLEFINNFFTIDKLKKVFNPTASDNIIWDSSFNSQYLNVHKKEFDNIFIKYLKKYPKTYINEYLINNNGFWNLSLGKLENFTFMYTYFISEPRVDNFISKYYKLRKDGFLKLYKTKYNDLDSDNIEQLQRIEDKLPIKEYYKKFPMISFGWFAIISIFIAILTILKKDKKHLIIFIPIFTFYVSTLLSTPSAFQYRYILYIPFSLPIISIIPFIKENN